MNYIIFAFNWVVRSSADPEQLSLTVKGFLLGIIPTIMLFVGLTHYQLSTTDLTNLFDGVAIALQDALTLVSACVFVYGLVRKLYITASGQHPFAG